MLFRAARLSVAFPVALLICLCSSVVSNHSVRRISLNRTTKRRHFNSALLFSAVFSSQLAVPSDGSPRMHHTKPKIVALLRVDRAKPLLRFPDRYKGERHA